MSPPSIMMDGMADIVVFVPAGSRVRYSPSQYITDDGSIVVMPAAAIERPGESPLRIPESIRAALAVEPLVDAQPFVDVQALVDRLQYAERAAAMHAWCAVHSASDRDLAATELTIEWINHVQNATGDPDFPHPDAFGLDDAAVKDLADRRRATRERVLARLEADFPHPEEAADAAFLDEADRDEG